MYDRLDNRVFAVFYHSLTWMLLCHLLAYGVDISDYELQSFSDQFVDTLCLDFLYSAAAILALIQLLLNFFHRSSFTCYLWRLAALIKYE